MPFYNYNTKMGILSVVLHFVKSETVISVGVAEKKHLS